jgi:biotin carboxylase
MTGRRGPFRHRTSRVANQENLMHSHDRPVVLLLGTDRYLLDACERCDVDAVVVCGAATWDTGFIEVPERLRLVRVDDQTNPDGILAALHRAGVADLPFAGVHTSDEWALVTASLLAKHLGCPSIDPDTAVHFRDKSLQKRRVTQAGVRAARVTVIDDIYDVSTITELPYPRAVLKPVAGAATARTSVVADMDELRARSREYAQERIPQRAFVLEEFVHGDEWIIDGVCCDGDILFCAVGAYRDPCLTTVDQNLPLSIRRFETDSDAWVYDKAVPFARTAVSALGLRDGVFHLEAFHDPDTGELTFSECAARRGGGLVHEELQIKFNVHLGECALLCAMGRRPSLDVKHRPGSIAMGFLTGKPGVLIRCPTPAELTALPDVEFARIEAPYGTRFASGLANTNTRVGQVLVSADTPERVTARLAEVRAWFADRVVAVPDRARPRELRAWQRETIGDDFRDSLWR